uniref:non-specific serine/threonine protein kinase n=1 Tax=Populus alba TaxID=43335 RepID=A0A4U5MYT8_POPAL|nr:G-type lectin S-receptor-like serine/threonine-protein kinase [Populus alba]
MNQSTYFRQRYTWNEINQTWVLYGNVPRDYCDTYNLCGAYGNCIISQSPVCECLEKFTPKSPESWNSMDWSQGCVRNKPLDCQKGDGFVKYVGLKLPDATNSWVNKTMNLKECRSKCLQNCSCMAYTATNIKEHGGCAIWFGDLIDIKQFPAAGQEIYIRMNASESKAKAASKIKMAVGSALSIFVACGILLAAYYIFKRKAKLIGKAWRLWKDGKPLELIEAFPGESCNLSEVIMRCINISLLCVQQHPDDRPSMATVVWMLGGENTLPQPKEPGFFKGSGPFGPSSSSSNIELSSNNEFTASLLYPR